MPKDLQMHPKRFQVRNWNFQSIRDSTPNSLQTRQRIWLSSSISDSFDLSLSDHQGYYERKGVRKVS
jgi:hypothetical protein